MVTGFEIYNHIKFPKVARYKRNPRRIYTIMDFEDNEIIKLYSFTQFHDSNCKGYAFYINKDKITCLVNIDELIGI